MGQPKGCIPWNKGISPSLATRLKMSASGRGRIFTESHLQHLREARKANIGEKAPSWKGGITIDKKGYVLKYSPGHPYVRTNNYYPLHRFIVEKAIGRFLKSTEIIHHVNGIKNDNRPRNLVACQDEPYHQLLHKRMNA